MKKTVKYAKNGALIGSGGFALINLIEQLIRINNSPEEKFNWNELLKKALKGAAVGGATGGAVGAIADINNSFKKPINTTAIIGYCVHETKLDKRNPIYRELSAKADYITKVIEREFAGKLGRKVERIGSTEEGTALKYDFDIDLAVSFKFNSFPSTEEMFETLYSFLLNDYNDSDLVKVRRQRKSVGLVFNILGEELKIDVVPVKLSGKRGSSGYLFINNDSFFKKDSYTKTDISSLKGVALSPLQRKLLVALKNWRNEFSIPISSHLLKNYLIDAFKVKRISATSNITSAMLEVVKHIGSSIDYRRIVSSENTNNVLTDINESDKRYIKKACCKILDDYDYQPNSIVKYFG